MANLLQAGDSTTIAFGSCNLVDADQRYWRTVAAAKPDLWIWLGDNIYADDGLSATLTEPERVKVMEERFRTGGVAERWRRQYENPEYAVFRQEVTVTGIWDDHDYGLNNAGIGFTMKEQAESLFLDFLGVEGDDPRRSRPGIYATRLLGSGERSVRLILLDTRYFAEVPGGPEADLLGEAQWSWLEKVIGSSEAPVNIIASGIQVLAPSHSYERWGHYPQAQERLLKLIRESGLRGALFISGDRHIGEIALRNDSATPYPLADLTSSSLTHSWTNFPGEPNALRTGPVVTVNNFGLIEVDWDADGGPVASLQLRSTAEGALLNHLDLPLVGLRPSKELP